MCNTEYRCDVMKYALIVYVTNLFFFFQFHEILFYVERKKPNKVSLKKNFHGDWNHNIIQSTSTNGTFVRQKNSTIERKNYLIFYAFHCFIVWCNMFFFYKCTKKIWFSFIKRILIFYGRGTNIVFLFSVKKKKNFRVYGCTNYDSSAHQLDWGSWSAQWELKREKLPHFQVPTRFNFQYKVLWMSTAACRSMFLRSATWSSIHFPEPRSSRGEGVFYRLCYCKWMSPLSWPTWPRL